MARHLCVVARENSPLYGYLTIAFRERPAGAPTIEIVLDRRQADTRVAGSSDRRRHAAIDEAVRARGYAIFTGPGGGAPSRNDEAFIERAIGLLADVERRGPLALRFSPRRRALVSGLLRGSITVLILALVVVTVLRLGGIGRIADAAAEIADTTVTRLEEAWISLRGQSERRDERPAGSLATATSPAPAPAAPEQPAVASPPAAATPETVPGPGRASERAAPAPRAAVAPPAPARTPTVESPPAASPLPSREVAALESRPLPAFNGLLPRVEMSRQTSASGSGVVYVLRVTDSGGLPVSGAQIWLRGQTGEGQMRETRLEEGARAGVYESGALPPELMPPHLNVRVYFSNMRVEIPIDH
jgi:hypothetical protein